MVMHKKLQMLGRQVSSLDGANLEILVSSGSVFFEEIKTFIATYDARDIEQISEI